MNKDDALKILLSRSENKILPVLQNMVQGTVAIDPQVLEEVQRYNGHPDYGLRFWSRKVLMKYGAVNPRQVETDAKASGGNVVKFRGLLSIDELIKKLKNADCSCVSLELLKKIAETKESKALAALKEYLARCKDPIQISYLMKMLGFNFPSEELLATLMPYLKHSDDRVVANTLEGIEAVGSPKSIAIFSQMLDHPNNRVKAKAAKALAKYDADKTFAMISKMLRMSGQSHFILSACHAVKMLKDTRFLPYLEELIQDDITFVDSLKAIETIGGKAALESLKRCGGKVDCAEKRAVIDELIVQFESGNKTAPVQRNIEIVVVEQKIFVLEDQVTRAEAEKMACAHRLDMFGLIKKLLYRPKIDDVPLVYSEKRYEPFWVVSCLSHIAYTRERKFELKVDKQVSEVKIGDRLYPASDAMVVASGEEHCVEESRFKVFVDADSGEKADYTRHILFPRREIQQTEELMINDQIVVPAKVKASIVVREMLSDIFKPIKANEISAERIVLEQLNLVFRPVYAFEFKWHESEKPIVIEIDALTGQMVSGKAVKEKLTEIFTEENLFELGGEAVGIVVPGAQLAVKLAKAFIRKS